MIRYKSNIYKKIKFFGGHPEVAHRRSILRNRSRNST